MLVMTGRLSNVLARGTVTASTESLMFPLTKLYDGDPGELFEFGQAQIGERVDVDADLALGTGDFEDVHVDGAPPGWDDQSQGTASLSRDTVVFDEGASSVKLTSNATDTAMMQKVFTVRAGETLRMDMQLRGHGELRMQDIDTGQWLNEDLEWQDAETFFVDDSQFSAGVFDQVTKDITISPMSYWPKAIRRVGLRFIGNTASMQNELWVDAFSFVPSYNTLGIFGHNIKASIPVTWESANNSLFSGSTLLATITPQKDKFYHRISTPSLLRYIRVTVNGLNIHPPWIGELLVGASHLFERVNGDGLPGPMSPIKTDHIDHRITVQKAVGGSLTRGIARAPRAVKTFGFQFPDLPDTAEDGVFREFFDEVFRRSIAGHPAMVVPNTDRREVLYGHLSPLLSEMDGSPGQAGYRVAEGFQLDEMALPIEIPESTSWPPPGI